MRVDRRQFIQIGAAAALVSSGCGSSSDSNTPAPPKTDGSTPVSAGSALQIDFEGLYLVERKGTTTIVHLIDGPALNLPAHTAQMRILASSIDQDKTQKPAATNIIPAGKSDDFWLWDLKGQDLVGPESPTSTPDLTLDGSSADDALPLPKSEAGWHSFGRVPDLRTLCGATKITKFDAFVSSIALTHGHLGAQMPTDAIGPKAVWLFTDTSGKELQRRALTNLISYTCPTNGQSLRLKVGSGYVVFKPGAAQVTVSNLPPGAPCGKPCHPVMHHFAAFAQLVDAKFVPNVTLATSDAVFNDQAGADYCPGSQV